ncbi:MAG: NADH-dependent [FeFe] hydrogenase, group A6 [Armatimonadota bacterium]
MDKIRLTIDGETVKAEPGMTVLEAAEMASIHIPTLCYHRDLMPEGHCRVCLVEIEGQRSLQPACVFPAAEGMVVRTNSARAREARKLMVELLVSNHPMECLSCGRNQNCELQQLTKDLGVGEPQFTGDRTLCPVDESSFVLRDPEKCVLCRRCTRVCRQVQSIGAIGTAKRGWETRIGPAFEQPISDIECVYCGQCISYCPTGALRERDAVADVWRALDDPEKFVIVQTAPAVRIAIGEEVGLPPGTIVTGEMVTALRRLGFDRVFDTDFAADLTIMEEAHELLERLNSGGTLPLITSCCPGWVKFAEQYFPDLLGHLSTCKSPQQMFGAVAKAIFAKQARVDPAKVVVVSIMPCVAKKFECERPEMNASGYRDVDYVLTTRELGQMLREAGIDLSKLTAGEYDNPLGGSTGAAVIFGASGGVMEAALRTAYEAVTGETLERVEFTNTRGLNGIKTATIPVGGVEVRIAVAHGLANARKIMDDIREGKADYHFVEIMTCPGGCIGGGGQPLPTNNAKRLERAAGIYAADAGMKVRKSHENPDVQRLYEDYLGKPLSHTAHQLLHTHYGYRPMRGVAVPASVGAEQEE